VGVGNPLRGDDGVGPAVAGEVCRRLGPGADFLPFSGSGLDLLGFLAGYDRVVIVDALRTDGGEVAEGECRRVELDEEAARRAAACVSSHGAGVLALAGIARAVGVPLPPRVAVYGIGARETDAYREGLGEALRARLEGIAEEIVDDIGQWEEGRAGR